MLGSLPLGLLTPTIPCCSIYWAFTGIYVSYVDWTLNYGWLKLSEDENNIVWNKEYNWKRTQGYGLGWPYHNIEISKDIVCLCDAGLVELSF